MLDFKPEKYPKDKYISLYEAHKLTHFKECPETAENGCIDCMTCAECWKLYIFKNAKTLEQLKEIEIEK